MARVPLHLRVNGADYSLEVEPHRFLLDVLREDLGILGPKEACAEGECGACTVLLNGQAVNSCILLALQAQDADLITAEGLGSPGEGLGSQGRLGTRGELHPLQQAFLEAGAVQCGFCTPGLLVAARALLAESSLPTDAQIRTGLAGNLCRCTGYNNIVAAVRQAALAMAAEAGPGAPTAEAGPGAPTADPDQEVQP